MRVCLEPGCPALTRSTRCSDHTRERDKARGTRQQRGYDVAHVRLRASYQRRMDQGEAFTCWRCGEPIDPRSWHLGHDDHDRGLYRGPECVPCNTATAGRRGRQAQIFLVCGPPCSGKTTYVNQRRQPGDLVVDYDDIARRLGSPRHHHHEFKYHAKVEATIARAFAGIKAGRHERAWVIRSLPRASERDALARELGAEVVLLDAPDEVLIARAHERPAPTRTVAAIHEWRAASGISPGDIRPGG